MHLWPSVRIRDSFKKNYLNKLESNLQRMNAEKRQRSGNQQELLQSEKIDSENSKGLQIGVIFREVLMVLSCCYCCFCCGD
ncbi:uncharacterized protein LOC127251268 isoform X2 [Andrographis paniculata]|uniref:uncharacterized protein LOC127251268 isoform X2 n=1 Tax=Andrographis paniculata TaxID=175694 RepID=UPI0021E92A82|nr:uncharacterized protein LOC127251268 isoform X2 [Andrographis paniculata]